MASLVLLWAWVCAGILVIHFDKPSKILLPTQTCGRSKRPVPTVVLAEDAFLTARISEPMLTVLPLIVPPTVTSLAPCDSL